jgi:hypothetical protein
MALLPGLEEILSPEKLRQYPDYLREAGLP